MIGSAMMRKDESLYNGGMWAAVFSVLAIIVHPVFIIAPIFSLVGGILAMATEK